MAEPVYNPKYDLNSDGQIDDADMELFTSVYGEMGPPFRDSWSSDLAKAADFNGNGVVDSTDFTRLAQHYGAVKSLPQFLPREVKTARVTMRNPTAKAFGYTGFIYMGTDLAIVSEVSFSLAAGEEKMVSFPVTMPGTPGTYPVHIGVFSGGKSVRLYRAVEDVEILEGPPVLT